MEVTCLECGHAMSQHNTKEGFPYECLVVSCSCKEFESFGVVGNATELPALLQSTTGNEIDEEGVDHPKHYNVDPSGVECIEIVRHRNFNIGNAMKYLWRAGLKEGTYADPVDKQINDLKKAVWYLEDEIKRIEKERTDG